MRSRSVFSQAAIFSGVLAIAGSSASFGTLPSLGQAGNYAIFGSQSVEILVNSDGTQVNGDVAIGPAGELNFMGGGTITGALYTDAASTINVTGGSQILGGQFLIDMVAVDDDARAATLAANALTSTQSYNSIGNNAMIIGNGGLNVINVTNNIVLANGGTLTLFGNGSDEFLFNINGTMRMTAAASLNLINVTPDQIMWNFVGEGEEVLFENSSAAGAFLAIERDIRMEGGAIMGALISNGDRIKLQFGSQVTYAIPEPATGLLALAGLSAFLFRRRNAA